MARNQHEVFRVLSFRVFRVFRCEMLFTRSQILVGGALPNSLPDAIMK